MAFANSGLRTAASQRRGGTLLRPIQIEARAKELLDGVGISAPPVDLRRIARHLGAVIRAEPFEGDISGALSRGTGTSPVIGLNSLDHYLRQRFTAAHEIGHLVLHSAHLHIDARDQVQVLPEASPRASTVLLRSHVSSLATDPKEIEANRFAAALLMPTGFVQRDLLSERHLVTVDEIEQLAKRYKVSRQAMTFRLVNLGVRLETL